MIGLIVLAACVALPVLAWLATARLRKEHAEHQETWKRMPPHRGGPGP